MALNLWIGLDKVSKELKRSLFDVTDLLNSVQDVDSIIKEPKNRVKKIQQSFNISKNTLHLEEKIKSEVNKLVEKGSPRLSLSKIVVLQRTFRMLRTSRLWCALKDLWARELMAIQNNQTLMWRNILNKQLEILILLREILNLELNETHMHFGASADAHIHWEFLKKLWKEALEGKYTGDSDIRTVFNLKVRSGEIDRVDNNKLKRIMNAYLTGKLNEINAFIAFERLLFMADEDRGSFHGFNKKANIITVIQETVVSTHHHKNYFVRQLDSIASHCLSQGITHIEIRFPTKDLAPKHVNGLEFHAGNARQIERKYKNKIKIRFIEFPINDYKASLDNFIQAKSWAKRYLVAFDFMGMNSDKMIKIAESMPRPLCVHAGELMSVKDLSRWYKNIKTKKDAVRLLLSQIEACLRCKNIFRIGHASILGIDLSRYLSRTDPKEVEELISWQKKLMLKAKKINRKQSLFMEVNPTSNIKIGNYELENHPAKVFLQKGLPITINTDDRINFDSTLRNEFCEVALALEWDVQELQKVVKMQQSAKLI